MSMTTPKPPKYTDEELARAAKHAEILEEWRADKGLKWSEVNRQMGLLFNVRRSDDYLRKIAGGYAPLARAELEVREAIRNVLGISREEWVRATGLFVAPAEGSTLGPPEYDGGMVEVPLIGFVSAGNGLPQQIDNETEMVPLKILNQVGADPKNVFAYVVNGNSMLSEAVREKRSLAHGDVIFVERRRLAKSGTTVVAWDFDSELMLVKIVDESSDFLIFRSLHSSHPPMTRRPEEVHIYGVVIAKFSRMENI